MLLTATSVGDMATSVGDMATSVGDKSYFCR